MGFHAWLTLLVVLATLVLLVRTRLAPEFLLGRALAVLFFARTAGLFSHQLWFLRTIIRARPLGP